MSTNPYLASTHGHQMFSPLKIGKNFQLDVAKNSKQPKPPDKPLMPYMRYSKKVWDDVRLQYPEMKVWEISKVVGQMWRDLPDAEKQDYIDAFEAEKIEYNEALKSYHNSPAYQAWISSLKSKANKEHEDRDNHRRRDRRSMNLLSSPQKSDGRICIQQSEFDDDNGDYFYMKHLSAARYHRNHQLVNNIFNDVVVPDIRSVVTASRLKLLRKQVQSLTIHQQRLDEELIQLEEQFQAKKRTLLDSSEKFAVELKKRYPAKPFDEAAYQKMFDAALEQIKKEHAAANTPVTNESKPSEQPADKPCNGSTISVPAVTTEVGTIPDAPVKTSPDNSMPVSQ